MLQQRGCNVQIYEQAPEFRRIGAGINLGPNCMKVMREIGIEQRLVDIGLRPASYLSREWNTGQVLFDFKLRDQAEEKYGAPYLLIHRGDFHAVLTEAVSPGTIRFGKRLTGLEENEAFVRMAFEDGTAADAEVVIGADGVNSMVREVLLGPEQPRYTGMVAHRAIFPASLLGGVEVPDLTKWWSDETHGDRHCLVYGLDRDRQEYYIVSGVREPGWDPERSYVDADLDEMCAAFDGFHDDLMRVLRACPAATKWPLFDREPLPLWSSGRIVLLGDACHPMKPHMGQGAAIAAEDAAVLVRCLEHVGYEDFKEAFTLYERSRKARASDVQRHSQLNKWLRSEMDPGWCFGYDPMEHVLGEEAGTAGDEGFLRNGLMGRPDRG